MSYPASQRKEQHWLRSPRFWLLSFVLINLIVGGFIAADYGESTDEYYEQKNASAAVQAYSFPPRQELEQLYTPTRVWHYYGTAQTAIFEAAEQTFSPILGTPANAIRHYGYFVSFQVGVVAIYFLVSVFTSSWVALAVSILFGTQPLLFGHAFINYKDIPLLSLFTAVVAAGFHLSRKLKLHARLHPLSLPHVEWASTVAEIKMLSTARKISILAGVAGILTLARVFAARIAGFLVVSLFNAPQDSLLGRLLPMLAANADAGTVDAYIHKGTRLFTQGVNAAAGLMLVGLVIYLLIHLRKKNLIGEVDQAGSEGIASSQTRLPVSLYLAFAAAGALWGFAIATRVIGLAAGGIVGLCLLLEFRKKSVLPLVVYTLAAGLVCYAAWPYLWAFGFPGFVKAVTVLSNFTAWEGRVLFEGQVIPSGELPPYYMLKLITLQLTIPVLILTISGILLSLADFRRKPESRLKAVLLLAWFALPILYTVIRNTVQYDNFRQYLFILPPLFVFTGIALDWLVAKFQPRWILPAAAALSAVPAVIALVQLHPFQYIYYNALAGGVEGAFREYELDYWLTSYMHAAEWADENIPPGSSILVWGGSRRVEPFIENEFEYRNPNHVPPEEYDQADYVIVTTEFHLDQEYHAGAKQIFSIERNNVPLVRVLQNQP